MVFLVINCAKSNSLFSICACDYNIHDFKKKKEKKERILLGKATILERDNALTIFTSKVIDVPSTFRNEDNEYVLRIPIDPGDRYRGHTRVFKGSRRRLARERTRFMDR